MGYAGINNNLAIEFDIQGNAWDPNSNHVAVQSCGPATNTPVHLPGTYTIGQNHNVTSCLLSQNAINTSVPTLGENCTGFHCTDGAVHQVVVEYTPPAPNQQLGTLQVWLDPQFIPGTHTPVANAPTVINVPYNVTFSGSNPTGLNLDNGSGWVGFTGSQPVNVHRAGHPGVGVYAAHAAADYADHSSRRTGRRLRISAATKRQSLIPTDSRIPTASR